MAWIEQRTRADGGTLFPSHPTSLSHLCTSSHALQIEVRPCSSPSVAGSSGLDMAAWRISDCRRSLRPRVQHGRRRRHPQRSVARLRSPRPRDVTPRLERNEAGGGLSSHSRPAGRGSNPHSTSR